MSKLGNEMETETVPNTPRSSAPLSCIAFRDECLHKATNLSLFIKSKRRQVIMAGIYEEILIPHFAMFAGIYYTCYIWDSDSSLCNIGRWDIHA